MATGQQTYYNRCATKPGSLTLPAGVCVDVVPLRESAFVARPYGFYDAFKGKRDDASTQWMGKPVQEWMQERQVSLPDFSDLQKRHPSGSYLVEALGFVLRWMISEA